MPLVLSENEATESGITYADSTGASYEFPKMYRRMMQPGVSFIYYRGRKKLVGRQLQVYFGTGNVGEILSTNTDASRLTCEILNFVRFENPIPFKTGARDYLERNGQRRGYFQQGVRTITAAEYNAILLAAGTAVTPPSSLDAQHRSIVRMARTAVLTSLNSNGQIVQRRVKNKRLMLSEEKLCERVAVLFERQKGRCAITGLVMQLDGQCDDLALLPSLDRIDSEKHYTAENLQLVCRFINKWKGAEKDDEFRRMISLIRK